MFKREHNLVVKNNYGGIWLCIAEPVAKLPSLKLQNSWHVVKIKQGQKLSKPTDIGTMGRIMSVRLP